jgi:nucleotide-binding universal stress UspA family protein
MRTVDCMIADFSRIVVPIDGSALSLSAARAAAGLARRAGLPVTLFGMTFDEINRHEVLRSIEDFEESNPIGYPVDVVVEAMGPVVRVPGYVASSIVEQAQRDGALVCMASHGRSGVGASVLGSTTEQVLRDSAQPLLVVGPHYQWPGLQAAHDGRVVACLDGSELSERSLVAASQWAQRFGVTPWLVQVSQPIGTFAPDVVRTGDAWETNYVRRLAHGVPNAQYDVLHSHDAARELADLPGRWPVEILVVASHGRSGLSRLALGSVAMRIVHRAPCPVLVVPPDHTSVITDGRPLSAST